MIHVLIWIGIGAVVLVAGYFGLAYYFAKNPHLFGTSQSRRYDD